MDGRVFPLIVCCVAGGVTAGVPLPAAAQQNLPPLRVDPALLGAPPAPPPETVAPRPSRAPVEAGALPESAPATPPAAPAIRPVPPAVPAPPAAPASPPAPAVDPGAAAEPPPAAPGPAPAAPGAVFLAADRIRTEGPEVTVAEGNVDLRRLDNTVSADRLTYWQVEQEVEAEGNVVLTQDRDRIAGPKMRLNLDTSVGYFDSPVYSITRSVTSRAAMTGHGRAGRIDFEGEDHYRLTDATYSTCGPDDPDWYAQGSEVTLDYTEEMGEARHGRVVFQGVPIMYSPWLEFPLNNRRKSGFLAPTFGSTSLTGVSLMLPYYWNIAPDMDATLAPRYMSKRGLQLGGEFRYLDPDYAGTLRGEYLPDDQVLNQDRHAYAVQHTHRLPFGVSASLDLNGVSDDTYFTDLATRSTITSQTNLLRQGVLAYSGGWWTAQAIAQRYQTLQDPELPPVVKPYEKLPQLLLTALRPDILGLTLAMLGDYTDFSHSTLDQGRRFVLYPQASFPLQTEAFFLTPRLGLHYTRYDLERRVSGGPDGITRTLPITSVDAGVVFERDADWFGRALTQTLEPRLYYLYVPFEDQSQIPLFDTARADYNFAQIFSDNIFSGSDRIADANQITAAVVSRLLDANGAEVIRGALGQRFHFSDQRVTLPGVPPRTDRTADLLAALSGRLGAPLFFDTSWEFNPNTQDTQRFVVGARYQPGPGRVLSAGYRMQRDVLEEIDLSGQWPFGGRWHGVGRYNYSLQDRRLIEAIGGVEYNAGCWAARFVVQRFATTVNEVNNAIFLQLELNGFSRIGSNPLDLLTRSIPGYGRIEQPTADPVFGGD
jgi:LPS-assembly protein